MLRSDRAHADRQVAIKLLPDIFSGDQERLARFEREAKLLASLNHPNIAAVFAVNVVGRVVPDWISCKSGFR